MNMTSDASASRHVGIPLGIGITLLPLVFSWLTLRSGHSTKARAISFAWLIFSIVLYAVTPSDQVTSTPQSEVAEVAAPAAVTKTESIDASAAASEKTLGMTPKLYVLRLNLMLNEMDPTYRLEDEKITEGSVNNVLRGNLGTHAALVATVSKSTGELLSVTLIGAGDGSAASGFEIMLMASAALAAAISDGEPREILEAMPRLLEGNEQYIGGVKLSASKTDVLGTWFHAEAT
jgi:hypothetical protein